MQERFKKVKDNIKEIRATQILDFVVGLSFLLAFYFSIEVLYYISLEDVSLEMVKSKVIFICVIFLITATLCTSMIFITNHTGKENKELRRDEQEKKLSEYILSILIEKVPTFSFKFFNTKKNKEESFTISSYADYVRLLKTLRKDRLSFDEKGEDSPEEEEEEEGEQNYAADSSYNIINEAQVKGIESETLHKLLKEKIENEEYEEASLIKNELKKRGENL